MDHIVLPASACEVTTLWRYTNLFIIIGWRLGVMVNIVGRIKEVNQRRARLVLGWVTILGG